VLKQVCRLATHEPGVRSISMATLDANRRCLFFGAAAVSLTAIDSLGGDQRPPDNRDYYDKRVEFAHFVDEAGREWTGETGSSDVPAAV